MAYMSQAKKAELAPAIKAVCKKYDVKASIGVRHHSGLVLNIAAGPIDFIANCNEVCVADPYQGEYFQPVKDHISVNPYHYQKQFSGKALAFLEEVIPAMMAGNHNNSDIMVDYFDVGWYIYINIGQWDKAYKVAA